jgi:xylose isomerase
MRNYLILKHKAAAFRADPDVVEALAAVRAPELAVPTLSPGERASDLGMDDLDPAAAALRGSPYEHLDQLALEHLLGVRG